MKLGLKDPRPGAIKLRFATYVNFPTLPTPPDVFGHYDLIPEWGMLGNDAWGDCALAGACHQEMLWTTEGGNAAPFDTEAALRNYSEVTGFDPKQGAPGVNRTDQGTDMGVLAMHWLRNGIVDSNGTYHKVVAIMDLNPGDLRELWAATYLFQSVGLGFVMTASAMQQAEQSKPWDIVPWDGGIQGGHYVPAVGRVEGGNGVVVTWGKLQQFTPAFYRRYNNQGIVAMSEEMLVNSKSIDGFDDALLKEDLKAFGR